jgi:hypothetical protein
MKLNPAKFHYIVGEAAAISDVSKLKDGTSKGGAQEHST